MPLLGPDRKGAGEGVRRREREAAIPGAIHSEGDRCVRDRATMTDRSGERPRGPE